MKNLIKEAELRGLATNESKTKRMICSRKDTTKIKHIETGERVFQKVENLQYLRVVVNVKSKEGIEIVERTQAGRRVYWKYQQTDKANNK